MTRSKICCDGCDYEQQTEPATYGGRGPNWITVAKSQSQSGDALSAGEHHFCNDDCLKNFMLTGKKVVTPKAKASVAQVNVAAFKKLFPRKKIASRMQPGVGAE